MFLKLDRIRTNGGTQPRVAMSEEAIADYAEAMEAGAKFPPVTVHFDGETYWLTDGFHRFAACKRVGFTEIEVEVRQGSLRDGRLYSFGANATHGLRRTNEDKRRAVMAMLEDSEWAEWPNTKIARACGVSHTMVNKFRPSPGPILKRFQDSAPEQCAAEPDAPTIRKVERNGTVYEQKVDRIGRSKPAKPAADPETELAGEIAQAEAEIGVALTEVEQLKKDLAEARETIAELTEQVEWLTRAADGNAADEIKKLAVQLRTVERTRDDFQNQNAQLKREVLRLERRLAAQNGGVRAYAA